MSCLSHVDIARELGDNVFIYPLSPDNIKGASVNLTASNQAWSISTKKTIILGDYIEIPPNDTALIETAETVHVTKKIAGTYHSKVALVSKGLGHIGTTLDPGWIGPSLIAIHNLTDSVVKIKIGDSFVSLMLFYVKTPSKKTSTGNNPGRPGVLIGFQDVDNAWLDVPWRGNIDDLKGKLEESPEYKDIKKQCKTIRGALISRTAFIIYYALAVLLAWIVVSRHLFGIPESFDEKSLIPTFLSALLASLGILLIVQSKK